MNFNGKNIMITGASGGMGEILCEKLAKDGANLALCSNDVALLNKLTENLGKYDIKIVSEVVDVTDEMQVAAFVKKASQELGKFDALANLAGLSIPKQYAEADVAAYVKMIDVNVKGSFLMSKHFASVANNPSRIINIGSMAARNTNANAPIYCMAKAAVNKLSEGLLLQLGKQGIRVSTINPGGADTTFWGDRPVDRSKLMSASDVVDVIYFVLGLNENIQLHCVDFESFSKYC